jgi:hypothetical protein
MLEAEMRQVIGAIKCPLFPSWRLRLDFDGARPYLQVANPEGVDAVSGLPMPWTGRKWMLSSAMTRSELVFTAFKALETAMEHELREHFTFLGRRIFDPHRNVDLLVMISHDPNAIDARS